MKLCPQCDFIYEDDQERCDMDGIQLVYEPTLQTVSPSAAPEYSRLLIPIPISPPSETFKAPPTVVAAPRSFGLAIAAGVVLTALVFVAYYASPRVVSTRAQTSANKLETQNPENGTANRQSVPPAEKQGAPQNNRPASSPASDQSPITDQSPKNPESPSSSPSNQTPANPAGPSSSLNPANDQMATTAASVSARNLRTAHATGGTRNATDNRLTIPKLPPLTSLPRVQPLRRLPTARPEEKKAILASTPRKQSTFQLQAANQKLAVASQKPVSVNYNPASINEKKQSRFGSFLKKTGRIITKPFKQ